MHHPTDRITHTTAFVTPVVEHWLEWEIAHWVHSMKDRSDDPSHHEQTLLPRSYISLLLLTWQHIHLFIKKTTTVTNLFEYNFEKYNPIKNNLITRNNNAGVCMCAYRDTHTFPLDKKNKKTLDGYFKHFITQILFPPPPLCI